jgi:hypothetical protein
VKIEVLYFEGCPGYMKAGQSLTEALAAEGLVVGSVNLRAVEGDEEAGELKFPGNPTIRVDGRDLFPVEDRRDWSLGRRIYTTPEGIEDHPTTEMVRAALSEIVPRR